MIVVINKRFSFQNDFFGPCFSKLFKPVIKFCLIAYQIKTKFLNQLMIVRDSIIYPSITFYIKRNLIRHFYCAVKKKFRANCLIAFVRDFTRKRWKVSLSFRLIFVNWPRRNFKWFFMQLKCPVCHEIFVDKSFFAHILCVNLKSFTCA